MRFRLVPKSSTLDDLERPKRTLVLSGAEKMRLLEPTGTAQTWMKIDPYMQRQKCRPMTLVFRYIRHMWILAWVPLGGGLKWEGGCWQRQFLAIRVATSLETSEIRPAVLYDDMLPVPCWPDCKMNDLQWPWVAISRKTRFSHYKQVDRGDGLQA